MAALLLLAACGRDEPVPDAGPPSSWSPASDAAPAPEVSVETAAGPAPPEPVRRGALGPDAGEVAAEAAAGAVDLYRLDVEPDRFARIVVEQDGVDVEAALEGPGGATLVAADRPIGVHGPELVLAVTERSGSHALRVTTGRGPGRYRVRVETLRPATPADRALAAAYRRFLEAGDLERDERQARWQEAVETARRLGSAELEGEALWRLGDVSFIQERDHRAAAERYGAAAEAFARAGAVWGEAFARVSRGAALLNLDRLEEAAPELNAGLEAARSAGDRFNEARALSNRGDLATRWGELQRGLDDYQAALELWPEDDRNLRPFTLHGLGVLAARYLGDPDGGRVHLRAAAAAWPDEWSGSRAITLNQLGQIAYEAGAFEEAWHHLEAALALSGDRDPCRAAVIGARLALVEQARGSARAAERRVAEALSAAAGGACPVSEPTVGLLAAELAERRGDPAAARARYRRSLDLYAARRDVWGSVESLGGIARIERGLGETDAALATAGRALELVEGVRPTILREDLRTSYFARAQDLYDLRIDLLSSAGRSGEAWATAERARAQALRDLLAEAGAEAREGTPPALAGRERSLQRRLNDLERRRLRVAGADAGLLGAIEREIDAVVVDLEAVRGEIRRGLLAAGAAAGAATGVPTAAALRAGLDPGDLLLEYRLGAERSHLWAVTREGVETFELPPRDEVERLARRAAAWLESPEWRGGRPAPVCALARAVLGPAAARLDSRRLLLVPDGALETIAFAALPEPGVDCAGAPPLIAGREIVHLPSAAVLGTLRRRLEDRKPAPGWLAVVADPVYGAADERLTGAAAPAAPPPPEPSRGLAEARLARSFSRLPHAGEEAEAILGLAPPDKRLAALGFAAGRPAVLDGSLARHRILHFATHGVLDAGRPLLSFLALSQLDRAGEPVDGPLYAHEIYGLDLPAELVVLSACDTARGREVRGEGLVSGLPRAFLYAGAARVLVSLWQVRDDSTRELMTAFYRGLIEGGRSPAQALREAQLAMWRRGDAPYRWAGFVLQGDPRPLPPFPP